MKLNAPTNKRSGKKRARLNKYDVRSLIAVDYSSGDTFIIKAVAQHNDARKHVSGRRRTEDGVVLT